MKKQNLLVLYSHNPSRLDHLLKVNLLRKHYRVTLVLDSKDVKDWHKKFVDEILEVSMTNSLVDLDIIVSKIKAIGMPDAILNLSEVCVPLHAALANIFNLVGMPPEIARIARNKYFMRRFAKDLGIPIPKFLLWNSDTSMEAVSTITFPAILKPSIGGGSGIIKRFETFQEFCESKDYYINLAKMYSKDPLFSETLDKNGKIQFVLEELIGGETQFDTKFPYPVGEVSVESVFFDGQCKILAIHDKMLPANGPFFEEYLWSTPSRIPKKLKDKAFAYVSKIHQALGAGVYVLHTEFRTFSDELVLLEFGARMGGGPIYTSVKLSTSNDFIDILIALSKGNIPEFSQTTPKPTITHCLWNSSEGQITQIKGLSAAVFNPFYMGMQIYDDIGDYVYRAPNSTRACGHIIFRNDVDNNFSVLEDSVLDAISKIKIDTQNNSIKPSESNSK